MGGSKISGTWTLTDRKLHINCLEFKAVTFALQHWAPLLQGRQVMIATDNSIIVSYINKQGGTRSPTLLRLTVDLFLWLESQSINSPGKTHSRLSERDSRPPISSEPANTDRVVPAPRDRESYLQGLGDTRSRHVCDTVELPLSSVHVSSSGAKSPSGGCSVSRLAGEVNVHVSPIPPAQQGHAETTVHSSGGGDPCSPLVAVSVVVFTSTSLCETPSGSPLPSGSSVPAGPEVHLRRKVVPSARMESLMRHYKAAGFSDEVSRLAAAPRRPSTYRMYDDRWRRFTRWAAGQGFDPLDPTAAQIASFLFDLFDTHSLSPQTIKGYRTCIGSVLNRTGRAKVVLHRTISDMIASMELQRPRTMPVLPQRDLGVVLEALSKSPYEPLREASFKHLTLKTVFLLAMASAGRRSELHALRFDQNYIQFKPKGAGVTLYFSPEFMRKNQKPNQVNDPWYIPAIPTGKPEFGAPNCPVRALRYYHRYLTEHPDVRKDIRRLFVPIKDNNAGKELSASSISKWICTTIVDSHAAIQDSKNLSGSVKAHEVRAVATSLQLFNKVDLHSFCHEGRKMVQWWNLHFLLPQRSLPSSRELTESRTHSGSRGHHQDLHLLARLAFFMLLYLGCFFWGTWWPLSFPKKGGAGKVPR